MLHPILKMFILRIINAKIVRIIFVLDVLVVFNAKQNNNNTSLDLSHKIMSCLHSVQNKVATCSKLGKSTVMVTIIH